MNNRISFENMLNDLLTKDNKYSNELTIFKNYLIGSKLIDQVFDLSINDLDDYFDSLYTDKVGFKATLTTHISALKTLFNYMISNKYNFRSLLAHISTKSFREQAEERVKDGVKKGIIPIELLNSTLYKMDEYISINANAEFTGINEERRYYYVVLACLYAKLTLLIPIKPKDMLIKIFGDIRNESVRHIEHQGIVINIPNGLRRQIINTIDYAEKKYNITYSSEQPLFVFLFKAIVKNVTTSSLATAFEKAYEEIGEQKMLEKNPNEIKDKYTYTAESYKATAICELLNNGIDLLYLHQLTGLDHNALLANYDENAMDKLVDIKSKNINGSIINTGFFTYL